jgi:hypothetical protein
MYDALKSGLCMKYKITNSNIVKSTWRRSRTGAKESVLNNDRNAGENRVMRSFIIHIDHLMLLVARIYHKATKMG